MAKDKFLLVSLNESKAKELAQAISNETCRKILDYLAEKETTESELAEKLNLPISTVHYNLQQLQKGNLVVVDEFHYSKKGKEINHYKLANKYIIIAPKSTYGIKEKLRGILPVAIIIGAGAAIIQFVTDKSLGSAQEASPLMMVSEKAAEAPQAAAIAADTAQAIATNPNIFSSIALWFIIGAVSSVLIYILIDWLKNRDK